MSRQIAIVVVAGVALFAVAVFAALSLTGGDSSGGNVHTMPGDQTMTGPMHTMSGGEQMPGMTHSP